MISKDIQFFIGNQNLVPAHEVRPNAMIPTAREALEEMRVAQSLAQKHACNKMLDIFLIQAEQTLHQLASIGTREAADRADVVGHIVDLAHSCFLKDDLRGLYNLVHELTKV